MSAADLQLLIPNQPAINQLDILRKRGHRLLEGIRTVWPDERVHDELKAVISGQGM